MPSESRLLAGPIAAHVLVIDDEVQLRDLLKTFLGENGYGVETAEDGRVALEKVKATRFDVVICDLKMPGMDGIETIGRIREIRPDIQFIVLTAHGSFESAIESLRAGVFDFLRKPLLLKDILFSVRKALERCELLERLALYELSRSVFSTLDPVDLYGKIVRTAVNVLRADDASLMLLDENRELQVAHSTWIPGGDLAGFHVAIGERVAGRVALGPEPAVINDDVASDPRFAGVQQFRPVKAAIVCPLTMRGELLGVLNVSRVNLETKYGERERQSAMILSSLVALALGNARLHKELQARLQQVKDTQEEIIQNEKMVALGSLLSGVAHELNNPLCAVLGYAQLMQLEPIDGKVRKGIEVILREADRAAKIINDLLRVSRREKPEKRPLGLSGVLLKTLERKSYDLRSSRVEVATRLDPELPLVFGDFHQLQLVFNNLITNAQQAMFDHHGSGNLSIRGEHKNGCVVLTFADDGPGIAEENLRRVFDPFFTTKGVGKGIGLGLSVCFAIVRDHGGALRVSSPPAGRGAVFTVEIPTASPEALAAAGRAEAPADQPPAGAAAAGPTAAGAQPPSDPRAAGAHRTAGPRVLIAEAEPHVQDVLVELLAGLGYRADTAETSESTLAKIKSQDYEAVIADFEMPNLGGQDLLDTLGSLRPRLLRRVIFLASDAARPQLLEFASTTGNLLMGKPFRLDAMRDALRRLFPEPLSEKPGPASGSVH
jgi:two-component system cell cycle sensor histidine kinase/response regulator CckA